jgi:hypothetical protein
MCSDRCWVASRGRQLTQGEVLSRAVQAQGDRHERRVRGAERVNRLLADAALANDVKRYREDRSETLRLIGRLESPGRGAADPPAVDVPVNGGAVTYMSQAGADAVAAAGGATVGAPVVVPGPGQ